MRPVRLALPAILLALTAFSLPAVAAPGHGSPGEKAAGKTSSKGGTGSGARGQSGKVAAGKRPARPRPVKPKPVKPRGGGPALAARSWIVVDPRDGAILAEHAPHRRSAIASTTKLMTAFVVLKTMRPSKILTAVRYRAVAAESLLGLEAGEKLTVKDLLYALLLPSANDAAQTLAQGSAGSEGAFVAEMNRRAVALGLDDTHYASPVGLDDPRNYSSASDLVALATRLRANKLFARIVDTKVAVLRSGATDRRITSRNTLLFSDPTVNGVKTGHTTKAGYVLVASAERSGTTLISAVLGAPSEAARDSQSERLLDYAFSQYTASTPARAGQEMASPSLDYRGEDLSLVAERSIQVSARRGQSVRTTVDAPDEVKGAVTRGERIGSVTVRIDGRVAGRTALVAAHSVPAASTPDRIKSWVSNPLVLIPVGLIVIGVGMLRRRRHRVPEDPGARLFEDPPAAPVKVAEPEPKPQAGPESEPLADKQPDSKELTGRTPEERRRMHDERMRKRQQKAKRKEGRR